MEKLIDFGTTVNDDAPVDFTEPQGQNEPVPKKQQVFTNMFPVLLEKGVSAPLGTQWICVGISSTQLHLKPLSPIPQLEEGSMISFDTAIVNGCFRVEEVESII